MKKKEKKQIVTFSIFSDKLELIHGISTRQYGSIKQNGIICYDNASNFARDLKISLDQCALSRQIHGKDIAFVDSTEKTIVGSYDGLITNQKGIMIGIASADCLPIIFYSPEKKLIGVLHAGFKGLLAGIIEEMLKRFINHGAVLDDILVGIGPAIGICCYVVPKERVKQFEKLIPTSKNYYRKKGADWYLNLKQVAENLLIKNGIKKRQIEILPICTKCNIDTFFSFRGDSKESYGAFLTLAGIV